MNSRLATPLRALVCVLLLAAGLARAERRYDPGAWRADYAALKTALEQRYAHLGWAASPSSGIDLPALDRTARQALRKARNDAEAAAAIQALVSGLHDAHLSRTSAPSAVAAPRPEPAPPTPGDDVQTACAAYGYGPVTHVQFSIPIESLPGFILLSDGLSDAFRSGIITVGGARIGALRIPRFRPTEFPALCVAVWKALREQGLPATQQAVADAVDTEWLRQLAQRLAQLREFGATAVLADLGDNGGGNDLGDWAVRLFTGKRVHSAPMLLTSGPAAISYFDVQLAGLRRALALTPPPAEATRAALEEGVKAFERRKAEAKAAGCDMSWVWREQRPWGPRTCANLVDGGFASGHLDAAPREPMDPRALPALYWPAPAERFIGFWDGPTYIFTDEWTGSSAEMFASLMRDSGIAKTLGVRTRGLGCGFADHDEPVVLPNSRLAFRIPNCVRLRSDGSDDIAGVAPDLPLRAQPGESARSLAARALELIASDLAGSPGAIPRAQ